MKKIFLLGVFLFAANTISVFAQSKVNWMSIETAMQKNKTEKRKIFVDVFTEWCGWCKRMDAATFQQPEIAAYLNANYYPVKLDAEQRAEIIFKDKKYQYVAQGNRGYHAFAAELLKGQMSYPTVVFMDEELNVIQPLPGYQAPTDFEPIMKYFGGNFYKSMPWQKYQEGYKK